MSIKNIDIDAIKAYLSPHLDSLKNFNFSVLNPVFWAGLIILFLILLRYWEVKKSFSFCAVAAIILLSTTKLEGFIVKMMGTTDTSPDTLLIKVFGLFIFAIVTVYYAVIK